MARCWCELSFGSASPDVGMDAANSFTSPGFLGLAWMTWVDSVTTFGSEELARNSELFTWSTATSCDSAAGPDDDEEVVTNDHFEKTPLL